jgi:hypothetical protein
VHAGQAPRLALALIGLKVCTGLQSPLVPFRPEVLAGVEGSGL